MAELLADGYEVALKFPAPAGLRSRCNRRAPGWLARSAGAARRRPARWRHVGPATSSVACGRILEVAIPFADLTTPRSEAVSFFIAVYDRNNREPERHRRCTGRSTSGRRTNCSKPGTGEPDSRTKHPQAAFSGDSSDV
jgi:hypothetical protein